MTQDEAEALFHNRKIAEKAVEDAKEILASARKDAREARMAAPSTTADKAEMIGWGIGLLVCACLAWEMLRG